jgi:hypothetical protein
VLISSLHSLPSFLPCSLSCSHFRYIDLFLPQHTSSVCSFRVLKHGFGAGRHHHDSGSLLLFRDSAFATLPESRPNYPASTRIHHNVVPSHHPLARAAEVSPIVVSQSLSLFHQFQLLLMSPFDHPDDADPHAAAMPSLSPRSPMS